MKKLLMVGIAALSLLIGGGSIFAQEYKLFYSGVWGGTVTVTKDTRGKITITPRLTLTPEGVGMGSAILTHDQCPLVPEGEEFVLPDVEEIVIDGNTTTITKSNYWSKTVVDGNTTTQTHGTPPNYSGSFLWRAVVDGNTTTLTHTSGNNTKTVVDGNTTTLTLSDGNWEKTVIDGNTTTWTNSSGRWTKTVVDGNVTIKTDSFAPSNNNRITVVDRQGYNIYISINTAYMLVKSGYDHSVQKDYDKAIADYTLALRLDPDNTDTKNRLAIAYSNRGIGYYNNKDYTRAIADFEAALRINPNHANSQRLLGEARKARGY